MSKPSCWRCRSQAASGVKAKTTSCGCSKPRPTRPMPHNKTSSLSPEGSCAAAGRHHVCTCVIATLNITLKHTETIVCSTIRSVSLPSAGCTSTLIHNASHTYSPKRSQRLTLCFLISYNIPRSRSMRTTGVHANMVVPCDSPTNGKNLCAWL